MKLAIDCRMYGKSGLGAYLKGILDFLLQNPHNKYVLLGNLEDLKEYLNFKNCIGYEVDIPPFSIKELLFFPVKIINECDYFYSPNYNIPLGIKIPILSTIHDVVFLDIPNITSPFKKLFNYIYLKRIVHISECIFTVSNFSRERIIHHFNPKCNIIVTYNGISSSFHDFSKTISDIEKPYLLYIGNIKKHKGLKTLLKAFSLLNVYNSEYKLVIVGESKNFKSSDEEVMKYLSDNNKKNSNIIFTGYIDQSKLQNIISNASILIQPSLYEGFGIPPLESMHLNTPVIISDIPVFKEIYADFPVTFFKAGDPIDLCNKILNAKTDRVYLNTVQLNKYKYKTSAEKILHHIN